MKTPDFNIDDIALSFDLDIPDVPYEFDCALDDAEAIVTWQQKNPDKCPRCGKEDPLKKSVYDERVNLCQKCWTLFDGGAQTMFKIKSPDSECYINQQGWDKQVWVALGGSANGE